VPAFLWDKGSKDRKVKEGKLGERLSLQIFRASLAREFDDDSLMVI